MSAELLQPFCSLCDPMGRSLPGYVLQAGILEWTVMLSSRGLVDPGDLTGVSYILALAGGFFTTRTTFFNIIKVSLNS